MPREKYVYNSRTLKYEKVKLTKTQKLFRSVGYLSAVVFSSLLMFVFLSSFFPSPKENSLVREVNQLEYHYGNLSQDLKKMSEDIESLHEMDSEVHRIIFGMEPVDDNVWNGGIGGSDRYTALTNFGTSGYLIEESVEKVDQLQRKINLQRKSLDTLLGRAIAREKRLSSIPSIKPVQEDKLKRKMRHLSGYGWRIHPVHKVKKFHYGIDFTAPRGTAIQATGDGKIIKITKQKKTGYGYSVTVDHGFGYETLYAHMYEVNVKKGDLVKKGQELGTVGSTGLSTAPHCHYEVHLNGKQVNPIDYVLDGLTPEEYQELVQKAGIENQSFD